MAFLQPFSRFGPTVARVSRHSGFLARTLPEAAWSLAKSLWHMPLQNGIRQPQDIDRDSGELTRLLRMSKTFDLRRVLNLHKRIKQEAAQMVGYMNPRHLMSEKGKPEDWVPGNSAIKRHLLGVLGSFPVDVPVTKLVPAATSGIHPIIAVSEEHGFVPDGTGSRLRPRRGSSETQRRAEPSPSPAGGPPRAHPRGGVSPRGDFRGGGEALDTWPEDRAKPWTQSFRWDSLTRSPSRCQLLPCFLGWEGSPTKIDYQKKKNRNGALILTSLLHDTMVVVGRHFTSLLVVV